MKYINIMNASFDVYITIQCKRYTDNTSNIIGPLLQYTKLNEIPKYRQGKLNQQIMIEWIVEGQKNDDRINNLAQRDAYASWEILW